MSQAKRQCSDCSRIWVPRQRPSKKRRTIFVDGAEAAFTLMCRTSGFICWVCGAFTEQHEISRPENYESLELTQYRRVAYCPQPTGGHPNAALRDTAPLYAAGRFKNQREPGTARCSQES